MHKLHSTPGAIVVKPVNLKMLLGLGGAMLALVIPAKADAAVSKTRLQNSIASAYSQPVRNLLDTHKFVSFRVKATAVKGSKTQFDLKFTVHEGHHFLSWYGFATVKRGSRSTRVPRFLDGATVKLTANQYATVESW